MITTAQAAEFLDKELGISPPSYIVQAAVDTIATAESAMAAAGYTAAKQVLVQSMAVAIVAAPGAPRRIQSQGAPSGASRSFKNEDDALSALRRQLAALDTANTVGDLVGPDPCAGTFFAVIEG
jgi:hypothetical protein